MVTRITLTSPGHALIALLILMTACGGSPPADRPGASPDEAFETYRGLLGASALSAESNVLTADSRALLQRGYSKSQQAREAKVLSRAISGAETAVSGDRAVIWFPASDEASPYLLLHSRDGWQVDLASMARYIGFDRQDQWYFRTDTHPYSFAFE